MCVCVGGLVLFLCFAGSSDGIHVFRVGSKQLYLLSHLPDSNFLTISL